MPTTCHWITRVTLDPGSPWSSMTSGVAVMIMIITAKPTLAPKMAARSAGWARISRSGRASPAVATGAGASRSCDSRARASTLSAACAR